MEWLEAVTALVLSLWPPDTDLDTLLMLSSMIFSRGLTVLSWTGFPYLFYLLSNVFVLHKHDMKKIRLEEQSRSQLQRSQLAAGPECNLRQNEHLRRWADIADIDVYRRLLWPMPNDQWPMRTEPHRRTEVGLFAFVSVGGQNTDAAPLEGAIVVWYDFISRTYTALCHI